MTGDPNPSASTSAPGPHRASRPIAPNGPAPPAARPASLAVPPTWAGRTGRIGYVAKMFPRISETFILDEVLAMRRNGIPVKVYSVLPPVRDARTHAAALALVPDVEVLSPAPPRGIALTLRELAECFRARPLRAAIYLARAVFSSAPRRRLRRLGEVAHPVACLRRDRIAHVHAAWAHTPANIVRMACPLTD